MIKIVNGAIVELTPEEEATIVAEWAANAAKPPPEPRKTKTDKLVDALIAKGVIAADDIK